MNLGNVAIKKAPNSWSWGDRILKSSAGFLPALSTKGDSFPVGISIDSSPRSASLQDSRLATGKNWPLNDFDEEENERRIEEDGLLADTSTLFSVCRVALRANEDAMIVPSVELRREEASA